MHLESVYKSRPYLFEMSNDNVGGGEEIVSYLIEKSDIKSYDSIKFLCSNYEHDAYRIIKDGIGYCVKYSFDPENTSLKNESKILEALYPVSPKLVHYEKIKFGEILHYSISSFEFAENVKDFGLASLLGNWDSFFNCYKAIENIHCEISFSSHLNSFLKTNDLNSFPEDAVDAIKDYYDFSILQKLVQSVQNEIAILCKPSLVKKDKLCHGKLQPSNILFRNGYFKFIDFTSSYLGNPYIDLAKLALNLGLDSNAEKEMLSAFLGAKSMILTQEEWQEYRSCYDIAVRMLFIELLITYLKEVYIFSSFRPAKILNIIEVFSKNNKAFFRLPSINKHSEFIYKMILEPIIGKE